MGIDSHHHHHHYSSSSPRQRRSTPNTPDSQNSSSNIKRVLQPSQSQQLPFTPPLLLSSQQHTPLPSSTSADLTQRRQTPLPLPPHPQFTPTTIKMQQQQQLQQQPQTSNSLQRRHSLPKIFSSDLDQHILWGLTIAGSVVCCLNTLFGIFHVDVFLRSYELSYTTYSVGRVIFSILSTGCTLWGARYLDTQVASTHSNNNHRLERCDLVGCLGVLLAISFILPFGRFWVRHYSFDDSSSTDHEHQHQHEHNNPHTDDDNYNADDPYHDSFFPSWYWEILDGIHFVVSMTLYDTFQGITTISLASAVSDDHNMTDQERVENMSSSQLYNLVASLIVASMGIKLFDPHSLVSFQIYVIIVAAVSIGVFGMAQSIISGRYLEVSARNRKHNKLWHIWKGWTVSIPKEIFMIHQQNQQQQQQSTSSSSGQQQQQQQHPLLGTGPGSGNNNNSASTTATATTTTATTTTNNNNNNNNNNKIAWQQVFRDLWNHSNFMKWLFLEMLLEMQTHFVLTFFKTFLDELLVDVPHIISDWSVTLLRPMHQLMTIACYVPIRYYGYPRVYTIGLVTLWLLSSLTLVVATPTTSSSTVWVLTFLIVYAVGSEALRAAGFYLVMSDLVLELKQSNAQQGRWNEPSIAGLLLGATTLVCKPMQSVLPVLAATLLDSYPDYPQHVLFYLLVIPPWICSILQLGVWFQYDLHPHRTHELKVELQEIYFYRTQQQQQQQMQQQQQQHQ